jgi:hypothetical protein
MKCVCPNCGQHLEFTPEMAGIVVNCPSCVGRIGLPSPDTDELDQHYTDAPADSTRQAVRSAWWLGFILVAGIVVLNGREFFTRLFQNWGGFPVYWILPASEWFFGFIGVLIGLLAPRWRLACAGVLAVLVVAFVSRIARAGTLNDGPEPLIGIVAGAIMALGIAGWLSCRARAWWKWSGLAAAGGLACGLVYARYTDWPAFPDADPWFLHAKLPASDQPKAIYTYWVEGRDDPRWQCFVRIDADAATIRGMVPEPTHPLLGLLFWGGFAYAHVPGGNRNVPDDFWDAPPHYWPRSLPQGWEIHIWGEKGPLFGNRWYTLVHDPANERAFLRVQSFSAKGFDRHAFGRRESEVFR